MQFFDTTQSFTAVQKHQYWMDSVCKRLIPADAGFAAGKTFEGKLGGYKIGNMTVCHMASQAHSFTRTEQHIRTDGVDDLVAVLVEEGSFRQQQQGRSVLATRGDIILYDAARPFQHCLEPESVFLLRFPRKQILSRFPQAESMLGLKIAEGSTITALLLHMAHEAIQLDGGHASDQAKAQFSSAMADALTAAMQIKVGATGMPASRYDAIYDKALGFIVANLDDCEMGAASVAQYACVSMRTLARVFAAKGQCVAQQIWHHRLEKANHLLLSARVQKVSQAAIQCGFTEVAHFSKAFRLAFGKSPREVLAQARQ